MKLRKSHSLVQIGILVFLLVSVCWFFMNHHGTKEGFDTQEDGVVLKGNTHEERKQQYNDYLNSLPSKRRNEIPKGEEDKYILKSQILIPICPRCPDVIQKCEEGKKCPPCPACARCPEPAYDCKLVPNYANRQSSRFPRPVLTDFSNFGM